ncbi:Glu/Leu/Phe/Val dehydrogenase dimerization domain-containing protein [Planctomycetota bacterium]
MKLLHLLSRFNSEQVLAFNDPSCGLKGFLVIDTIKNGVTFGGVRLRKYKNELEAFNDAIRLAKTMTKKCDISGVPGGGSKVVLMENQKFDRSNAMKKLGEIINEFGGTVYAGRDVGTTLDDMKIVGKKTSYVIDESESKAGDLAKCTAYGVMKGMEAMSKFVFGKTSLKGRTILIQGLGSVGAHLMGCCNKAGAKLILADVKQAKAKDFAKRFRCRFVMASRVYETECDIFSPCAVGEILNRESIKKLKCQIVAGSANNVYEDIDQNDRQLYRRKIVTVPDFLLNAGALIQGANYILSKKKNNKDAIDHIFDQTLKILRLTKLKKLPPGKIVEQFLH